MQTKGRRSLVKILIEANVDKFIGVTFVKKDGSIRHMNGRLHCVGAEKEHSRLSKFKNYLILWDVQARGFRTINLDTLASLRMKGGEFVVW